MSWRIYDSMDASIRRCIEDIMSLKRDVTTARSAIAHPPVSDAQITQFLKRMREDLETSNIALFDHLRQTSNTAENVQNATKGSY
jgi:hypothetical protein